LKLIVFYKDILKIITNKYFLQKYIISVPPVLKVYKFTLKLYEKYIYFHVFISLTKYIFISIIFIPFYHRTITNNFYKELHLFNNFPKTNGKPGYTWDTIANMR